MLAQLLGWMSWHLLDFPMTLLSSCKTLREPIWTLPPSIYSLHPAYMMPTPLSNSPKSPSLNYLAPSLTSSSPAFLVTSFAMPNCMDITSWNNSWFRGMEPLTSKLLIGMPTMHIGIVTAVKSESLSMLPTTLRPQPTILRAWLPHLQATLPQSQLRWPMALALTLWLHPLPTNTSATLLPICYLATMMMMTLWAPPKFSLPLVHAPTHHPAPGLSLLLPLCRYLPC